MITDQLQAGVEALRNGQPAVAAELLVQVASDPALSKHPDLQDMRARVCSLLAQSLLEAGQPQQAQRWVTTALRILRQHPDFDGQQQVRELQERIEATAAAAAVLDPELPDDAGPTAHRALEEATASKDARGAVEAMLTLARTEPEQASAWLHRAWKVADDADEFVLVTTVIQTASVLGISLGVRP